MNLTNIPVLGRINDVLKTWKNDNLIWHVPSAMTSTNIYIPTNPNTTPTNKVNLTMLSNGLQILTNVAFMFPRGTYNCDVWYQQSETARRYCIKFASMTSAQMDILFPNAGSHASKANNTTYSLGYVLAFLSDSQYVTYLNTRMIKHTDGLWYLCSQSSPFYQTSETTRQITQDYYFFPFNIPISSDNFRSTVGISFPTLYEDS